MRAGACEFRSPQRSEVTNLLGLEFQTVAASFPT